MALTRSGRPNGESTHLAKGFFAGVRVAFAQHMVCLLLTEVDAVEPGSWLASPDERSVPSEGGLGILEVKLRSCPVASREFDLRVAKGIWAQCCLGAVQEAVIGMRAGNKVVSVQRLSQAALVSAVQREEAMWHPESAITALEERLAFVLSHVAEGDDILVSEREGRLRLQDRASGATIASFESSERGCV